MINKTNLTLGSLFSGSGGFELAGILAGIRPKWNCDVEPFPIRVTTKRFPDVKHYGDISTLNGAELEPVDIITGGFPCQSVSIAGKREGIRHVDHAGDETTRRGLCYEATRIIKEMREATNGQYPKYAVAENVPGLFSSNGGEDFRCVLEEICKIKMPSAHVPAVKKWSDAGLILGGDFSIAWRVLDAQYHFVPQRRRRVFIVTDFRGEGAGKILFEQESLRRDFKESFRAWKRITGSIEEGSGEAGIGLDRYNGVLTWDVAQSLTASAGSSGDNTPMVFHRQTILNDQGGDRINVSEDVTGTLRAETHGHPPVVMDDELKAAGFCTEHSAKSRSIGYEEEVSPTLRAGIVPAAMALQHNPTDSRIKIEEDGNVQTLCSRMGTGGNNVPLLMEEEPVPITMKVRCGCEGGGKGILTQANKSATLATNNDQTLFVPFVKGTRPHSAQEAPDWKEGDVANTLNTFDIGETRCNELAVEKKPQACSWDGGQVSPTLTRDNADGTQHMPDKDNFNCVLEPTEPEQTAYGISSYKSHAMLSDNPHAGIYEAKTSRTLDVGGGDPGCHQGGICVVEREGAIPFTQNQRDEVRDLGDKAGALAANPGMKQQTYVAEQEPTAFHVNTRRELVDLHGKSGALMASQSDQMQTFVIQGSMIGRDDKNGPQGDGINEDVSFTLNTVDRHAVAAPEASFDKKTGSGKDIFGTLTASMGKKQFLGNQEALSGDFHVLEDAEKNMGTYAMTTGSYMDVEKEKSPTLMARDYKDPTTVAPVPKAEEPVYTVRRLTPTECAALQGMPRWWCDNLGEENPSDEEVAFWTDVFETHRKAITHASKPKTEKQIRKWLADPYSDGAAYRMYGNGLAVPCALYVLSGIVWADGLNEGN